jgi:hypothetical protein
MDGRRVVATQGFYDETERSKLLHDSTFKTSNGLRVMYITAGSHYPCPSAVHNSTEQLI